MPRAEDYDLDFRPEYWWGPQDLGTHYGTRIKGELRRRFAPDDFAAGFGSADLIEPTLTEPLRQQLAGVHPWLMGGEYLPDFLPTEIEIARVVMKSTTMDVISIRARRSGRRIKYRIVDEYPEMEMDYRLKPASSSRPLSMKQLLDLIETADLINEYRQFNYESGCGPEEVFDFCTVSSDIYPDLARWFDQANREWLEAEYARIWEEDGDEEFEERIRRIEHPEAQQIALRIQARLEQDRIP